MIFYVLFLIYRVPYSKQTPHYITLNLQVSICSPLQTYLFIYSIINNISSLLSIFCCCYCVQFVCSLWRDLRVLVPKRIFSVCQTFTLYYTVHIIFQISKKLLSVCSIQILILMCIVFLKLYTQKIIQNFTYSSL